MFREGTSMRARRCSHRVSRGGLEPVLDIQFHNAPIGSCTRMTLRKLPSLRPGFPKGLEVLLIQSDAGAQEEMQLKLQELSYSVTVCRSCLEAVATLKNGRSFDLVITEAKGLGGSGSTQQELLSAAAGLPIILTAENSTSTDDVWKGIELGAAEVLERPLSSLKLRNIWQHVVRKMMHGRDPKALLAQMTLQSSEKKAAAPNSPRTPLSVGSAGGSATFNSDSLGTAEKSAHAPEPEASASVGMPDSADSAPRTRAATRRAHAASAVASPTASLRAAADSSASLPGSSCGPPACPPPPPSVPASLPAASWCPPLGPSATPTPASSMPWAPGLLPHQTPHPVAGCAWGTPLAVAQSAASGLRPAGLVGGFPRGVPLGAEGGAWGGMPAAGAAHAGRCVMAAAARQTCFNAFTACNDGPGGLHVPLVFPDGGKPEAHRQPPIGLKLRKSDSLLDLVNSHLAACA